MESDFHMSAIRHKPDRSDLIDWETPLPQSLLAQIDTPWLFGPIVELPFWED